MANVFSARLFSRLLLLTLFTAGCAAREPDVSPESAPQAVVSDGAAAPSTETSSTEAPSAATPTPAAPAVYADAISRGSAAFSLSQSARSKDDWRLTANRWAQAIALLEAVPESSPDYGAVPGKLTEYRRNLDYAQQQADIPIPEVESGGVVLVPRAEPALPNQTALDAATRAAPSPSSRRARRTASSGSAASGTASSGTTSSGTTSRSPAASGGRVYEAPIVRRAGGTPVILVTFNDGAPFEMIVDTGASGTVITAPMARALNVEPVGEARVATASASDVPFQLGYVSSLEVDGARVSDLLVAIAGPALSTGLLGQDFFSGYDITVRQSVVEFQER